MGSQLKALEQREVHSLAQVGMTDAFRKSSGDDPDPLITVRLGASSIALARAWQRGWG